MRGLSLGIAVMFMTTLPGLAADDSASTDVEAVVQSGESTAPVMTGATENAGLPRPSGSMTFGSVLRGLIGIGSLVALAWLMSLKRKKFPVKLVVSAIAMQLLLGLFLIRWEIGYGFFDGISRGVQKLLEFTNVGSGFVFGDASKLTGPGMPALAFTSLPTIIFFSCLMAILYHLRVMHVVIWVLAKVMTRFLGVTGAESMAMAANVFVGQTEAPLVVRRFLPNMTRSEIMSLMTGGFATIAGSVLAIYISFLTAANGSVYVPHLLIASVMSAPAAFAISKIIVPETAKSETGKGMSLDYKPTAGNVLDAAATGVSEGLKLWMNVFAMLLAFVALVALLNFCLGEFIYSGLSLSRIFGWVFAPLAFAMGIEWADAGSFGALLGMKVGVNEFLAFADLQGEINLHNAGGDGAMSQRSLFMATYALCGFANFSSIGIQIGGISPIIPERRKEIIDLSLRAMFGGALASWMTASIAGMFFS